MNNSVFALCLVNGKSRAEGRTILKFGGPGSRGTGMSRVEVAWRRRVLSPGGEPFGDAIACVLRGRGGHVVQGQEGHLTGFVGATPGML